MEKVLVCIPCYKESKRLPILIEQIKKEDNPQDFVLDILFLDDGSGEAESLATQEMIKYSSQEIKNFQLGCKAFPVNRGKGAVIRDGFKQGLQQGYSYVGFLDGDGATPFYEWLNIVRHAQKSKEIDVVTACRLKCLGKNVQRSLKRHFSGRIFATILSTLFEIPIYDSQCGAKLFKTASLSNEVLDHCYDQRWLFDPQLVILLFRQNKNIVEQPVDWTDIPGSKINLLKDSYRMFVGLLRFKKYLASRGL